MIILFLADGSSKIGMGHVYRSINLANELKNDYLLTDDSLWAIFENIEWA